MNNRAQFWILNGKVPEPCLDIARWGRWFENADCTIARDELMNGDVVVSTVFRGVGEPPQLFETIVFGEEHLAEFYGRHMNLRKPLEARRYDTWEAAEMGHHELVAQYRAAAEDALAATSSALLRK